MAACVVTQPPLTLSRAQFCPCCSSGHGGSPEPSAQCAETDFQAFILPENLKTSWNPQGQGSKSGDGNLSVSRVADCF